MGLALAGLSQTALAVPNQLVLNIGTPHSGVGGEFVVTSITGVGAGAGANYNSLAKTSSGFDTFCLEYNQYFNPGSTYYYQISGAAIKGGNAVSDPVSIGTAYLYGLFAQGLLHSSVSGYSYSSSTSAGNLQNTIWYLEGERSGTSGPYITDPGTFDSLLIAEFGSVANAKADSGLSTDYGTVNAASFGVQALNLGTTANGNSGTWPNQDQLIYQGGGFQELPDGGTTLALLGMALGGLSLIRRKLA